MTTAVAFTMSSGIASTSRQGVALTARQLLPRVRLFSSTSHPRNALEGTSSSTEHIGDSLPPSPPTDIPISPTSASHQTKYLTFPDLKPLPRPHNIHVATLRLQAHHPYPLELYTTFSLHAAHSLGIPTSNPAYLPTTTSLYTVLKSPFVHKKAQENFHRKTHRRAITVWDTDRSVVDLWLRYLKRHGIGGVGMRAEVHEWVEWRQVANEGKGKRKIAGKGSASGEIKDGLETVAAGASSVLAGLATTAEDKIRAAAEVLKEKLGVSEEEKAGKNQQVPKDQGRAEPIQSAEATPVEAASQVEASLAPSAPSAPATPNEASALSSAAGSEQSDAEATSSEEEVKSP